MTFSLDAKGIDKCSEKLDEELVKLDVERQNRLRIRLSIEESLLRMQKRFGEDKEFRLLVGNMFIGSFMQIELEEAVFNPLSKTEVELEDWSGALLTTVGLYPLYSYSRGKNILRLIIPRRGANSALVTIFAVALGILVGFALHAALPADTQAALVDVFLTPLFDFWVRLLTVISGPVIFLMVCTAVMNTGMIEEEGGNSKRVLLRYFLLSFLAAVIAIETSVWASGHIIETGSTLGVDHTNYFKAILSLIPDNVFAPFIDVNTPQILVFAIFIGETVVIGRERVDLVGRLLKQMNVGGMYLIENICRLVPFIAGVFMSKEILEENMQFFYIMWLVLIVAILTASAFIAVFFLYTAISKSVGPKRLMKILWPSFATAIETGGLDEGFGQMEKNCIKQLGLEEHFARVSLPYGIVLYMPINVIGTMMFTIYAAIAYQVDISYGWLFIGAVLSVVLFVATPPVPGANLLAYIMIFAQLGIPQDALVDAMVFDILFGIFASAGNQMLLQLDLVLQADKIGLLNKTILLEEKKNA